MRFVIPLLSFLAALSATAPASAELYKWVDERGVTNYSNEPPPAAATVKKLARVEDKISVYTPDENFMKAVQALRERSIKALTEPEPQPVARYAAQPPTGFEQCLLSGRLGCEDLYSNYYPGYLPGAFARRGVQPTRFLTSHAPRASRGPMR
jgi:hypothetical protein